MEKRSRLLTAAVALILSLLIALPAAAKEKEPKKSAVIAGTVFQETGFSLPGATVTVTAIGEEEGPAIDEKLVWDATTDRRGEYAIRVPAGSMRYNVRAEADGWKPAEKVVHVNWDQRHEISFRLKPLRKGSAK